MKLALFCLICFSSFVSAKNLDRGSCAQDDKDCLFKVSQPFIKNCSLSLVSSYFESTGNPLSAEEKKLLKHIEYIKYLYKKEYQVLAIHREHSLHVVNGINVLSLFRLENKLSNALDKEVLLKVKHDLEEVLSVTKNKEHHFRFTRLGNYRGFNSVLFERIRAVDIPSMGNILMSIKSCK